MTLALRKDTTQTDQRRQRQNMRPHEIADEARSIHRARARGEITPEQAEDQLSQLLKDTYTPFHKRIFGY